MFERFTEPAIKVILRAQQEARMMGHNFVGTEQILLGLIGEENAVAAKCLVARGLSLENLRTTVFGHIGRGDGNVSIEIPFTPRCKRLLELAWDEARQLGHNYVCTEHLLLGLIREGSGVGALTLRNAEINFDDLRREVLQQLRPAMPTPAHVVNGFSEQAVNVVMLAQEETRRSGHDRVGAEQVLLGMLAEGKGIAAKCLKAHGLYLSDVREAVLNHIGRGSGFIAVDIPLSMGCRHLIKLAWDESKALGHDFIGTEHLLLGMIHEDCGIATKVLIESKVDLEKLSADILRMVIRI